MTSEPAPPHPATRSVPQWALLLRAAPVAGPVMRRLVDVLIPKRGLVLTRARRGPLAGMVLEVDPRTQSAPVAGRYEAGVLEAMRPLLHDGDTVFDIGAHLGYVTLVMATRVGRGGRVVSFEPDPAVMGALQRNVTRNEARTGADHVVVPAAVGAEPGRAGFVQGRETSRGRLVTEGGDVDVEVMTLDDIAERFGTPALVKIDVEGREMGVLRGGTRTLRAGLTAFVIEAHSKELEKECVGLLTGAGYDCDVHDEPGRQETYVVARPPGAPARR